MDTAPPALRALLERRFVARHAPAWLELDGAGVVADRGGDLSRYGLEAVPRGARAEDAVDVLVGLLPLTEPLELPDVRTASGGWADLICHPHPDGTTVVWLDVTETATQRQLLQQQRYELRLATRELEQRERFIRQTFGRYLSGEIVEQILEHPDGLALEGETRRVTILMNDVRGFTELCERLTPEQVVRVLNRFLGAMTDVILRYGGTIDEFIGDAILVIFGAPVAREDDAARAVACAVAMMNALGPLNTAFREEGLPTLEMGIGLNTGEVVVGNIGSPRRLKYGVVGSAVNLTSRIEGFTVGGQILASDATVLDAGEVHTRSTREITPKGVAMPLRVHDVQGIGGPHAIELDVASSAT